MAVWYKLPCMVQLQRSAQCAANRGNRTKESTVKYVVTMEHVDDILCNCEDGLKCTNEIGCVDEECDNCYFRMRDCRKHNPETRLSSKGVMVVSAGEEYSITNIDYYDEQGVQING